MLEKAQPMATQIPVGDVAETRLFNIKEGIRRGDLEETPEIAAEIEDLVSRGTEVARTKWTSMAPKGRARHGILHQAKFKLGEDAEKLRQLRATLSNQEAAAFFEKMKDLGADNDTMTLTLLFKELGRHEKATAGVLERVASLDRLDSLYRQAIDGDFTDLPPEYRAEMQAIADEQGYLDSWNQAVNDAEELYKAKKVSRKEAWQEVRTGMSRLRKAMKNSLGDVFAREAELRALKDAEPVRSQIAELRAWRDQFSDLIENRVWHGDEPFDRAINRIIDFRQEQSQAIDEMVMGKEGADPDKVFEGYRLKRVLPEGTPEEWGKLRDNFQFGISKVFGPESEMTDVVMAITDQRAKSWAEWNRVPEDSVNAYYAASMQGPFPVMLDLDPSDVSRLKGNVFFSRREGRPRRPRRGSQDIWPTGVKGLTKIKFQDALEKMGRAREVAKFLSEKASDDSYRAIAGRLEGQIPEAARFSIWEGRYGLPDISGIDEAGASGATTIGLKPDDIAITMRGTRAAREIESGISSQALLHELTHAATSHKLLIAKEPGNAGTKLHKVSQELDSLLVDVKESLSGTKLPGTYRNATTSTSELIAYGMTDAGFQKELDKIVLGPKKTAFTEFVRIVSELLGISSEHRTALGEVIRLTDDLLSVDAGKLPVTSRTTSGQSTLFSRREGASAPSGVAGMSYEQLGKKIDELGNAKSMSRWLAENVDDKSYKWILKLIDPVLPPNVPVKIVREGVTGPGAIARHTGTIGAIDHSLLTGAETIWLRDPSLGSGYRTETLVHELLHVATFFRYRTGKLKENAGSELGIASKALDDLFRKVSDTRTSRFRELKEEVRKSGSATGRVDIHNEAHRRLFEEFGGPERLTSEELIAWGLTNKKFQEALKKIKIDNESAWTRFVRVVSEFLGVKSNDINALTEVLRLTEDIVRAPTEGLRRNLRDAGDDVIPSAPGMEPMPIGRGLDPEDPRLLFSRREGDLDPLAYTKFEDGKAIIGVFKNAKGREAFTAVVEELGHIFRRDIPKQDLQVAEKWVRKQLGPDAIAKNGRWTERAEEAFSKAFTKWVKTGELPEGIKKNPGLKGLFEKAKDWLLDVYLVITGKKSPKIRAIFKGFGDSPATRRKAESLKAGTRKRQPVPEINISEDLAAVFERMLDPESLRGDYSPLARELDESLEALKASDPLTSAFAFLKVQAAIRDLSQAAGKGEGEADELLADLVSRDVDRVQRANRAVDRIKMQASGRHKTAPSMDTVMAPAKSTDAAIKKALEKDLVERLGLRPDEASELVDKGYRNAKKDIKASMKQPVEEIVEEVVEAEAPQRQRTKYDDRPAEEAFKDYQIDLSISSDESYEGKGLTRAKELRRESRKT